MNSFDEVLKSLEHDSSMIEDAKEEYEKDAFRKVKAFVLNTNRNKLTLEQVNQLITKIGIERHYQGKEEAIILHVFLISKNRDYVSYAEIIDTINLHPNLTSKTHHVRGLNESLYFNKDSSKASIIESFLESEERDNVTFDQVSEMIEKTKIIDGKEKLAIFNSFIASKKRDNFTLENVRNIATKLETIDLKCDFLKNFFKSNDGKAIVKDNFAEIIKLFGLNEIKYVINLHEDVFSPQSFSPEEYVKNLVKIIQELQPSETMQCKFLEEFIKNNRLNSDNLIHLKPFINELKDNENFFSILSTLNIKEILTDQNDILDLLGSRLRKQYSFLTEIVDGKNLEECVKPALISSLNATFNTDLKIGEKPITVSDLFAYCDFKKQTSFLATMLKPEFKKQLRDNFSPSAEMLLYKPAELDKLNQLLGDEGVVFDSKNYFVENAKLCDYLKEKVGNVEEIDSSKTYQINFTNFGIEEEKQAELNTLFNELLKSSNLDKEEVAKFFIDLLQIELPEGEDKKIQLAVFFKNNKKEIAHCFCNFNLKKEDVNSALTSLKDGCHANIDMQFKNMLYGMMIKDEEAQILYAVAGTNIFSAIADRRDITHHGSSVNNSIIKSYFLSPMRLIEKLSNEERLNGQKATDIIKKNIGENKFKNLHERLNGELDSNLSVEDGGKIMEQKIKEIASYLIVKKVFGEEKIRDLESRNPQLKELGNARELSGEPSPEIEQGRVQPSSKRQRH